MSGPVAPAGRVTPAAGPVARAARGGRIETPRLRGDRGETLIELVVTVAILGIAGVAVMAGVGVTVKTSDQGRREATGGAYVRSVAEAIQKSVDTNGGYASCANAPATYKAVADATPSLPAGYVPSILEVNTWTGSAWTSCTPGAIQQLKLKVTSPGDATHRADELLTVVLRKPCNGSASSVGDDPCA